jgi:hypothetical protein
LYLAASTASYPSISVDLDTLNILHLFKPKKYSQLKTSIQKATTVKPSNYIPKAFPLPEFPQRIPLSGQKNIDENADMNAAVQ